MKFRKIYFFAIFAFAILSLFYCPNSTDDAVDEENIPITENTVDSDTLTCKTLDPFDYGACLAYIGVVFDGESCVGASGCGCGDDCDFFYSSINECNLACVYECPNTDINCMPLVLPEHEKYCEISYRQWIINNCPEVSFFD